MGKKLPIIHSKIVLRTRRTGPTKRKIPLEDGGEVLDCFSSFGVGALFGIWVREESLRDGVCSIGTAPAHEDHGEGHSRDDEAGRVSL